MKSFAAETLILGSAGTVWDIITDSGNYPVWDSGITDIKGEIRQSARIRVRLHEGSKRTFHLRVRQLTGRHMTWTGRLPLGLFTVERTFTLTDYTGMTHLTVRDAASGPLRRLMHSGPGADPAVSSFVDKVKFRAELLSFHVHGGLFPGVGGPDFPELPR